MSSGFIKDLSGQEPGSWAGQDSSLLEGDLVEGIDLSNGQEHTAKEQEALNEHCRQEAATIDNKEHMIGDWLAKHHSAWAELEAMNLTSEQLANFLVVYHSLEATPVKGDADRDNAYLDSQIELMFRNAGVKDEKELKLKITEFWEVFRELVSARRELGFDNIMNIVFPGRQ